MGRTYDSPIIANDHSLDRLLAIQVPVMIVFWSGRDLSSEMNQIMLTLASREAGRLIIAKIDVRENPNAAQRFNVRETPLIVGLRQGEEITRLALPTVADIHNHIQYLLGRAARPVDRVTPEPQAPADVDHPVTVTDAVFEQRVLQSTLPVLVDFWAPWCGPCHMIAPSIERMASRFAGRLFVAKVNVDENPHYAGIYGIQGIPTLLIFRNGKVINRLVGVMPEAHLQAEIERILLRR